ncbi:FabD/lysophospholipase-like protein [Mycena crocata]|nr:FabD/lysophospholipase-like protein [Mycena crocata]
MLRMHYIKIREEFKDLELEKELQQVKIEEELEKKEPLFPCDYFDLIRGTGTGGLEKVIKAIVKEWTGRSETTLSDDGALGGLRRFVCSMTAHNMNARQPVLFRSYPSSKNVIPCTVWQAARATSAAPTFFKRIRIGHLSWPESGLSYQHRDWPARDDRGAEAAMLRKCDPCWDIKAMIAMATDCEETAEQMAKYVKDRSKTYFRLNVDRGLQKVKLAGWDRLDEVASHTRQYIEVHEVGKCLDNAAKAMLGWSATSGQ